MARYDIFKKSRPDGYIISLEKQKFPYNRVFLEITSTYFKNRFANNWSGSDIILEFSSACIQKILEQIYDHALDKKYDILDAGFNLTLELIKFYNMYIDLDKSKIKNWIIGILKYITELSDFAIIAPKINYLPELILILLDINPDFKSSLSNQILLRRIMAKLKNIDGNYKIYIENWTSRELELLYINHGDFVASNIFDYIPGPEIKKFLKNQSLESLLADSNPDFNNPGDIMRKFSIFSKYLISNKYNLSRRDLTRSYIILGDLPHRQLRDYIYVAPKFRIFDFCDYGIELTPCCYLSIQDNLVIRYKSKDIPLKILNIYNNLWIPVKFCDQINSLYFIQLDKIKTPLSEIFNSRNYKIIIRLKKW